MQDVADDGDGNVLVGENKSLSVAGDEENIVLGFLFSVWEYQAGELWLLLGDKSNQGESIVRRALIEE